MRDLKFNFGDDFLDSISSDVEEARKASAWRTRCRRHARRATSEAALASVLPADIEDGDAWHVLSSGDVDSLSYLAHILATHRLDNLVFSTWCMAMEDVDQIITWIADGRIGACDAYVGEIFPSQYTDEYARLVAAFQELRCGRVAVFRNHSKIYLCRAGDRYLVVESSANVNTNPRTENTVITADRDLYTHHKAYFDGIRAFNREFG